MDVHICIFATLGKTAAASTVIWHATKHQYAAIQKYLQSRRDTDTHAVNPWCDPEIQSHPNQCEWNEIRNAFVFFPYSVFFFVRSAWKMNEWMNEWLSDW